MVSNKEFLRKEFVKMREKFYVKNLDKTKLEEYILYKMDQSKSKFGCVMKGINIMENYSRYLIKMIN